MKYRDKKNAERKNAAATYRHHRAFKNAKAYRDYMNREMADHAVADNGGAK